MKIEPQQQGKTIKGKVIDERGESLPGGVTVVVKGTSMGTTTDIDGNYILHNIPGSPVIIFRLSACMHRRLPLEIEPLSI